MSSNFLLNSINPKKDKSIDSIKINIETLKKILNNKKHNIDKKNDLSKYEKNLISLEKSYKESLVLLNILKNNQEKNIFKKYEIKDIIRLEKNAKKIINETNNSIDSILMKKKFLIIPPHTSSMVH